MGNKGGAFPLLMRPRRTYLRAPFPRHLRPPAVRRRGPHVKLATQAAEANTGR
ncbi:hypothetical protein FHS38_005563 [Streptomyces netropsis]|uniref:Uncharacterized protein n=1 Tax=Streptomyces netropsis TaxID=55404 RepID=A0A7W7PHP9_STRNE|nr:hypothetical protein [Streptomyces netropsis]GGR40432.1 hypothetical protein GCM10010219_52170 [Streptomyces netropsis]